MAYLEISKDKAVVQSPLGEQPMSIGRQPGNSIVINDPDISRRHCVIERWEGHYQISDLNSRNGTVVNGKRVQRAELRPGDVITLGGAVARFIDAPLKPTGRKARRRNVLIWGPALMVFLVSAFIVAWAVGLLGDVPSPRELRQRLGIESTSQPAIAPARSPAEVGDDVSSETAAPPSSPSPSVSNAPDTSQEQSSQPASTTAQAIVERNSDRLRYHRLNGPAATTDADRLLGRAVAARFIGKPAADAAGVLVWELPPDGEIMAAIVPVDADRGEILEVLNAEPLLLEVELCGALRRDRDGSRLVLRVGVIEILRAWGEPDEALRPATRDMLGRRMIIDPQYTAEAIAPSEG